MVRNRQRDAQVREALKELGWRCLTVWECALRGNESVEKEPMFEGIAAWIRSGTKTMVLRGLPQATKQTEPCRG